MPTEQKNKRIYWFNHQGMNVLMLDFSHCTPQESLDLIDAFPPVMEAQPDNSVYLLSDLTEAAYEPAIATKWRAVRMRYDPKIHHSAIYGLSGLVGVAVRSFVDMTILLNLPRAGKKMRIFKSREQALGWLVKNK